MAQEQQERPGYKTTEFWLSVAATLVGAVLASGALAEGSNEYAIVAFIGSALAALGYTACRGFVKSSEAKKEAAKALAEKPAGN